MPAGEDGWCVECYVTMRNCRTQEIVTVQWTDRAVGDAVVSSITYPDGDTLDVIVPHARWQTHQVYARAFGQRLKAAS